jgi:signal transduction histidine kinase
MPGQSEQLRQSPPCRHRWWDPLFSLRTVSSRIGLQGKLIICFMVLLIAAMGGSYFLFWSESRGAIWRDVSLRSIGIAQTLATASSASLEVSDIPELTRLTNEFIRNQDIVNVAFRDTAGTILAAAGHDPDFRIEQIARGQALDAQILLEPRAGVSKTLGRFATVTAPVLRFRTDSSAGTKPAAARLAGYVTLSVSQEPEERSLQRVYLILLLVGCVVLLLSFPAVYILVYRVLEPIRQLVSATNQITSGDLETRVDVDRPDLIGTLARSFNEMVQHIKRQRQDLADANQDLEAKVAQRTMELERTNKRLSNEIAEKEDFLRAVSHDLNAPLRNISGIAGMLLLKHRQSFDPDVIHRLERIEQNVRVETDLIGELLELSRIKTRRGTMEPVDLDQLVRSVAGVFDNDLKSKGIEVTLDSHLPVMLCEQARIRQVFQNLIDNAIKYMGNGAARQIHIGCEQRSGEVEIYVRDTGIGIDPEDIAKVFFVFRRGRNSAAAGVAGKGVGLASVKSIIENYNGSISVESELGRGSTFRFTLSTRPCPMTVQNDGDDLEEPAPLAA